jgi:hypothetical protein
MIRLSPRIAIAIATVLTLAFITSASASAKYARGLPGGGTHASTFVSTSSTHSDNSPATVTGAPGQNDSFDWGDAGIGAGGALVLTGLVAGGIFSATRTRRHTRPGSVQTTA